MFSSCNEKYEYDMCNTRKAKPLQFKRGSATAFRLQNPILLEGQPAWEIDTYRLKIGDGETRYNKLQYVGHDAKNGKSAYELWLEAGHTGTVDEFLEACEGKPGKSTYELWLELGNEGSLDDFINQLTGKSAYDIWLEAGNSGTEQEYLDSLKGKDGKSVYDTWLEAGNEGSLDDFIYYMHTFSWGKIE